MYLSQTNMKGLRQKVEHGGGFQIAIVPMQSKTFLNVKIATDQLYNELTEASYSVIVDDRDKKPKNKFEVIEFLGITHRIVISSRSISASVVEYKNLKTGYFEKVPEKKITDYLTKLLSNQ